MKPSLQVALVACLIAVTGASIWGGIGLTHHVIVAFDAWGAAAPNVQPTLAKANATLDAINAPCVGFHGSVTCGPLAQLSQTEKNVGIVAGQSALQVKQTGDLIKVAASSVTQASSDVHNLATEGSKTLAAATELTQGASKSLATTTETANSLLSHSRATVDDFDQIVRDNAPSLHATLENVQGITASGNGILADGKQVSDKATADYMRARTPWGKVTTRLWGGYDILAWAASHRP